MSKKTEKIFGIVAIVLIVALALVGYFAYPSSGELIDGQHGTGYTPDAEATEEFLGSLNEPNFSDAASELFIEKPKIKDDIPAATDGVFLYRFKRQAWKKALGTDPPTPNQYASSSCVGHGWVEAINCATAIDYLQGDADEWQPADPLSVYGGARVDAKGLRYAYGNGASGAMAAKFVTHWGMLPQIGYEWCDTTNRTSQAVVKRASEWGYYGNGGRSNEQVANEICKQYPVRQVALATTYDEAWTAIKNGYAVTVCSSQGFTSSRDSSGFCRPSGTWKHCMCFVGIRYDKPGLLCQNSWGNYVQGGKFPPDMPDGSFWVDERTAESMLSSYRDSYAVSGVSGFKAKKLDNGNWVQASADETHYALAP